MVHGQCALCEEEKALRDSHLLPRALYKSLRNIEPDDQNPLFLSKDTLMRTSKQVSDYLLCDECEQLFEKMGERWVLSNRFQWPDSFKLQDALKHAPRIRALSSGSILATANLPGINREAIIYFAASVFWRAAVYQWDSPHGADPVKLTLGSKYTTDFRRFLLGQDDFPSKAALLVKVSSTRTNWANSMVFPYGERRGPYHHYRFIIPGVVFDLLLGQKFPPETAESCFVRGPHHPVFLMNDDRAVIQDVLKLMPYAIPRGKSFDDFKPP